MVLRIIPLIYTAYTRRSFCSGGPEVIGRSELQNDPLGVEHHQEAARRRRRRCGIFLGEAANVRDEQWPKPWLADWLIIICNNRGPHLYIYIRIYIYTHTYTLPNIWGLYKTPLWESLSTNQWFSDQHEMDTKVQNQDSVESIRVRVCTMCIIDAKQYRHTHNIHVLLYIYIYM